MDKHEVLMSFQSHKFVIVDQFVHHQICELVHVKLRVARLLPSQHDVDHAEVESVKR